MRRIVWVTCDTVGCEYEAQDRPVVLPVAEGGVYMKPSLYCEGCNRILATRDTP